MDEEKVNETVEGEPSEENKRDARKMVEQIKEMVKKGNVARVVVIHNDAPILNVPLNAGILGTALVTLASPWAMIATVIATIGFSCRVQVVKTDGEVVEILHEDTGKKAKEFGAEVVREVKDAIEKK